MVVTRFTRGWQLLADESRPLIDRLDPALRAKVLAALAGLIILGFAMVLLTWLGARITRRYTRRGEPLKSRQPDPDAWARKELDP